jgi:hypothetical protein
MQVTKSHRPLAGRTGRKAVVAGLVVVAAGLAGFSGQASAQTIANGNFTSVNGATSSYTLSGNTTAGTSSPLPQWSTHIDTAGDPACVVIGNSFSGCGMGTVTAPSSGPGSAPYIAFMVDSGITSSISQTVALTAGKSYTLTFDAAQADNDGGTNTTTWTVSVGGTTIGGSSLTLVGNGATAWNAETVIFTATTAEAASGVLQFLAGSSTAGPPIALLDNVTLAQNSVPEPASMAVLGMGLAGLVGLRRRRAAQAA